MRFSRLGLPAQLAPEPGDSHLEQSLELVIQGDSIPLGDSISRASTEPTQTDLEGHYVGPSSGISFLSRVQKRFEQSVYFPRSLSVFNFGDSPLAYDDISNASSPYSDLMFSLLLNRDDTAPLVRRYFDFAVPVDRFLHQPTIEKWFEEFYETRGVMHDKDAAPAQIAVLFMIFAVAQEHTNPKLSPTETDMRSAHSCSKV